MLKKRSFWWALAICWCLIIAFATRNTFFTGDSTEELLKNPFFDSFILNIIMRKTGHTVAFGLLAFLFWMALRGRRLAFFYAWGLATFYGAIDEWHQSFIPTRDGRVSDVFINSFGALLAVVFLFFFVRFLNRRRKRDYDG